MFRERVEDMLDQLPIRRGKNFVDFGGDWAQTRDGWWLGDNWAWSPRFRWRVLAIVILARLTFGEVNYFYSPEHREKQGFTEEYLFGD